MPIHIKIRFLIAMLSLPVFLVSVLFLFELPQRIERGVQSQLIDQELHAVRVEILKFMAEHQDASVAENRGVSGYLPNVSSASVLYKIEQLLSISGHDPVFNNRLEQLKIVYQQWQEIEASYYKVIQQGDMPPWGIFKVILAPR